MQLNSPAEQQQPDTADVVIIGASASVETPPSVPDETIHDDHEPTRFSGHYESCMEMYADAKTVGAYLDQHQGWFRRCAHPMKADSLGDNGYALVIGRFGSFGYEVEPKVGLHLLPQDEGIYRIETIPIPDYTPIGYDVDFRASLQLVETECEIVSTVTRVEWELDLDVFVHFPRFIRALPQSLVHSTGDRVLNEIVRQVSRYLTHKVQVDFHSTHDIPFPRKQQRWNPWKRSSS